VHLLSQRPALHPIEIGHGHLGPSGREPMAVARPIPDPAPDLASDFWMLKTVE